MLASAGQCSGNADLPLLAGTGKHETHMIVLGSRPIAACAVALTPT